MGVNANTTVGGETFGKISNSIFVIDDAVIDFLHGWKHKNDTIPAT